MTVTARDVVVAIAAGVAGAFAMKPMNEIRRSRESTRLRREHDARRFRDWSHETIKELHGEINSLHTELFDLKFGQDGSAREREEPDAT